MTTAITGPSHANYTARLLPGWMDCPLLITCMLFTLRLPLLILCLALLPQPGQIASLSGVLMLIVLADIMDGIVFTTSRAAAHPSARRWRRALDAAADRLVVQAVCLPAVLLSSMSWPIYALISARELALAFAVVPPAIRYKRILSPNFYSRAASACIPILLVIEVAHSPLLPLATITFTVLAIAGLVRYYVHPITLP